MNSGEGSFNKVKIIYITRAAFGVLGGASSYFIPTYVSKKCDITVLSNFIPGSSEKIIFNNSELDVYDIYADTIEKRLMKIFEHIKRIKPDIIHVFHAPDCLRYPYIFKKLFPGIKWVLDFRSPPLVEAHLARKRILRRYFYCQFYYDLIMTHSKLTIKDNLPIRFRKVIEIPLGVELGHIPSKKNFRENPVKFVYIGSVAKSRELELFVMSFAKYIKQSGNPATLDIIGDGDALEDLKKLVEINKIEEFIKLKGSMSQNVVFQVMHKYDVGIAYVPYNKFTRAPSLKSLEYAAAGLPILASDTEGHKDFIKRFGFQFSLFENTCPGIQNALELIVSTDIQQESIDKNRKAVEYFEWEKIVDNTLLPAYKKLIN